MSYKLDFRAQLLILTQVVAGHRMQQHGCSILQINLWNSS